MDMLQMKQLTLIDRKLTRDEQQQICGGGAGPHNVRKRPDSATEFWSGYANEKYDLLKRGEMINFTDSIGQRVGSINIETGTVSLPINGDL